MRSRDGKHELPSLAAQEWLACGALQSVFDVLERAGFEARAVGGIVRNSLMGLPLSDVDIATTATPEQVLEVCRNAGVRVIKTGIDHGTVTLLVNQKSFEVTTLRRDVATDGRRASVAYTLDWHEDAARRDFTINALYCDRHGRVCDPLGGYQDIVAGKIRFIGDSDTRIAEDYLRILRFFRFFSVFGICDPDRAALDACVRGRAGLVTLSAERIRSEFMKLLVGKRVLDAIDAMGDFGLLSALLGMAPRVQFLHRMCEAESSVGANADPILRLSALCVAVEEDAAKLRARLRLTNRESKDILVCTRLDAVEVEALDQRASRQALYRLGKESWRRRVLAAMACGRDQENLRMKFDLAQVWSPPQFPLRGSDVMALGHASGPQVGDILRILEQWWVDNDFSEEDALRQQLRFVAAQM